MAFSGCFHVFHPLPKLIRTIFLNYSTRLKNVKKTKVGECDERQQTISVGPALYPKYNGSLSSSHSMH